MVEKPEDTMQRRAENREPMYTEDRQSIQDDLSLSNKRGNGHRGVTIKPSPEICNKDPNDATNPRDKGAHEKLFSRSQSEQKI